METRQRYNQAWDLLLAARREGNLIDIYEAANNLAHKARELDRESSEGLPCSHFMVINSRCVGCGHHVERAFFQHEEAK